MYLFVWALFIHVLCFFCFILSLILISVAAQTTSPTPGAPHSFVVVVFLLSLVFDIFVLCNYLWVVFLIYMCHYYDFGLIVFFLLQFRF